VNVAWRDSSVYAFSSKEIIDGATTAPPAGKGRVGFAYRIRVGCMRSLPRGANRHRRAEATLYLRADMIVSYIFNPPDAIP